MIGAWVYANTQSLKFFRLFCPLKSLISERRSIDCEMIVRSVYHEKDNISFSYISNAAYLHGGLL